MKQDQQVNYSFEQVMEFFSKQVLAIYKAKYLLNDNNGIPLSKTERKEVLRELRCSEMMAQMWFDILNNAGIPTELLSMHLQANLDLNT